MPRRRTPLREQAFRNITLIAVPLIAFAVTFVLMTSNMGDTIPAGLVWTMFAVTITLLVVALVVGLLVGKRIVGDRIELAFRAAGGKWRHGRVDIERGVLVLQPYWWQLRFRTGDPITLHVNELGEDTGRRPKPRQWWSLNPQLSIVPLRTEEGDYELAALPSHLAELRERLAEGEPAQRS